MSRAQGRCHGRAITPLRSLIRKPGRWGWECEMCGSTSGLTHGAGIITEPLPPSERIQNLGNRYTPCDREDPAMSSKPLTESGSDPHLTRITPQDFVGSGDGKIFFRKKIAVISVVYQPCCECGVPDCAGWRMGDGASSSPSYVGHLTHMVNAPASVPASACGHELTSRLCGSSKGQSPREGTNVRSDPASSIVSPPARRLANAD